MTKQAQKTSPIKTISGKNPILLIAPHGWKGDDEKTGRLTKLLAEHLECYAVINENYQRPVIIDHITKKKKPGLPDPKKKLFDLNNLIHIKKHLNNEFLKPILDYKDEIVRNEGSATVVLIHGIADGNPKADGKDIVIGIGLDDPANKPKRNRLTPTEAVAVKLKTIFDELVEPISTKICRVTERGGFSGCEKNNLNKLFTPRQKTYNDPKVQSIQLEIKKEGFRDTKKNTEKTAERLSVALAKLVGIVDLSEPEVIAETSTAVVVSQGETLSDTALVERAYQTLADMFSRHHQKLLLEAGQYIVKEFYGGNIELVKANKPTKGQSLNQLIKRFQSRDAGSPSRSWIYNAVNMIVDEADFKSVQTYGQLQLSQKIVLLPVNNVEKKKKLIEETVRKKYTVRQLKDRIAEQKTKKKISLNRAISNPDLLFSDDFSSNIDKKSLTSLPPKTIPKLRTKAQEQKDKIVNDIATQQAYIKRYADLIQILDTANKQKAPTEKRSK